MHTPTRDLKPGDRVNMTDGSVDTVTSTEQLPGDGAGVLLTFTEHGTNVYAADAAWTVQPADDPYFPADDAGTEDREPWTLTSAQRLRRLLRQNMMGNKSRPTLYVLNRHVSRSGMLRRVSVFMIRDSELVDVTRLVADVTGWKLKDDPTTYTTTLTVRGAGMDMHFHTVYTLGRELYPQGRDGASDGGYMIRHETI